MATILYTWELGGGLGHLARMVPIFKNLLNKGHRIVAAVKDLSRVERIFRDLDVTCLQAPVKTSKSSDRIKEPRSHAHILHNSGFSNAVELQGMAEAWRNLLRMVKPDLVLCDHSPTALLATRDFDVRRATIGNGFCSPPNISPWPDFRPWLSDISKQLKRDQAAVLDNTNKVLAAWHLKPLENLSQLYHEVDAVFLTTLAELDHYPGRQAADYFGAWSGSGGMQPDWPDVDGKKVFCYLKNFAGLEQLLAAIQQSGAAALVYINGLSPDIKNRFDCPSLRFASDMLDIEAVCESCDMAILNGGLAVTVSMLLAGTPIMSVPLCLEQAYNGSVVAQLEAGHGVMPEHPEQFESVLKMVLETPRFYEGAQRFSKRYADFEPSQQVLRISRRLNELATK